MDRDSQSARNCVRAQRMHARDRGMMIEAILPTLDTRSMFVVAVGLVYSHNTVQLDLAVFGKQKSIRTRSRLAKRKERHVLIG